MTRYQTLSKRITELALDTQGNIYVIDNENNRMQKIDLTEFSSYRSDYVSILLAAR